MTTFCRWCLQELRVVNDWDVSPNGSPFCTPDDRGVIPADCLFAANRALDPPIEPTMLQHHDHDCSCQRAIMHSRMADDRWPWYGQEPGQMALFEAIP